MSDYGESYKKYKTPKALASAVINGNGFRTNGCYFLTTSLDEDDVVAILDTNGPVGPYDNFNKHSRVSQSDEYTGKHARSDI